jgi:hypothetical protein
MGVKQHTMANKGRLIMDTLRIDPLDLEYCRREMLDQNQLVWLLEVDGCSWTHAGCRSVADPGVATRSDPYVPARVGRDDPA